MNNQIVLANPIATAVKPKPTKKEVVEALVQLKIQEAIAHNEALDKQKEKLKKALDRKAIRFVTRNQSKVKIEVSIRDYYHPPKIEVEFTMKEPPEELELMASEILKLNKERQYIDEKRVRRQIMEGLNMISPSGERVAALLKSPDSRQALEAILKEIEK